uniref:Fe2OG dioxygenase domain-containing protein n=1 Tax=viral metagenome TaxID=1070528 RepID=A0A6C0C849_9ZZZZ
MYKYLLLIIFFLLIFYFILDYIYSNDKFNINKIYEYRNIITDEQISEIIKLAEPLVKPSPVIGPGGKNIHMNNVRTSHNTFLPDKYPVVQDIYDKLSNIIGIDKDHFEQLQVVRYHPGQLYKEHWDACWEEGKCSDFLKKGGNRYATFLLYLNDDFEEGETYFPLRNQKITPEKGKAALFFNLDENNIDKLENSKHAGLPPKNGIKWMCNVWVRLNKIPK